MCCGATTWTGFAFSCAVLGGRVAYLPQQPMDILLAGGIDFDFDFHRMTAMRLRITKTICGHWEDGGRPDLRRLEDEVHQRQKLVFQQVVRQQLLRVRGELAGAFDVPGHPREKIEEDQCRERPQGDAGRKRSPPQAFAAFLRQRLDSWHEVDRPFIGEPHRA